MGARRDFCKERGGESPKNVHHKEKKGSDLERKGPIIMKRPPHGFKRSPIRRKKGRSHIKTIYFLLFSGGRGGTSAYSCACTFM